MGRNPKTDALEPLDFNHLIENLPEFKSITTQIDVYQFTPAIDSSDMNPRLWAQIVRIIADQYEQYDGFVVLHGTDTMAFTASALSYMLENLTKPVILTGSQLPISQLRTDGKENLVTSIEIASAYHQDGTPIVPEVCIYFSGKLLRGNRSTKINADGFNAFDSFNYPHLADAGVNIIYHEEYILKPDYTKPMKPHFVMDPNVVVFTLFPGIQENIVRHILDAPELRSIVMRTYGSGNAPQKPWLMHLLKQATEHGINIVNISQCAAGTVEMARYDNGYQLKNAGVISGYDATVESTVTKLMHLQGHYTDWRIIRNLMNHPMRGEFTQNL
jgi:L-asparaginase